MSHSYVCMLELLFIAKLFIHAEGVNLRQIPLITFHNPRTLLAADVALFLAAIGHPETA